MPTRLTLADIQAPDYIIEFPWETWCKLPYWCKQNIQMIQTHNHIDRAGTIRVAFAGYRQSEVEGWLARAEREVSR